MGLPQGLCSVLSHLALLGPTQGSLNPNPLPFRSIQIRTAFSADQLVSKWAQPQQAC